MTSPTKADITHAEYVHDSELVTGDNAVTREDAVHMGELSPEELVAEKKLLRRIDAMIMPLVALAAKLQQLVEDTHLSPQQYELALSILFVGYVLMQVPSNAALNYVGRPSIYIGTFVVIWGLVSTLQSQAKNPAGVIVCRFILGVVEAPFFSGVLFYLSKWYKSSELSLRMALFYSASLLSGAFGNLIAAGILHGLAGKRGLAPWQWLYIIEGTITMFIGIIIIFVLPDFPDTWKALPPELKRVANRRMALDAAEADVDEAGAMSQLKGIKLAFSDPKTYILALAYHCQTGTAGFQNFFPTLTKTLHYSNTISLLLVAPPYVFMVFWSFAHARLSDKIGNRFWFWTYPIPLTIIGFIIFMTTNSFGPRYFSFFLMIFVFAQNSTIYAWIASSIPRPPAKRAAAFAFINSFGNAASIWTPYTYFPSSAPHYRPALGAAIGLQIVGLLCGVFLRFYLQRQNKQLARMEDQDGELKPRDLKKLQKTADLEGVPLSAARHMQKGYRYML